MDWLTEGRGYILFAAQRNLDFVVNHYLYALNPRSHKVLIRISVKVGQQILFEHAFNYIQYLFFDRKIYLYSMFLGFKNYIISLINK